MKLLFDLFRDTPANTLAADMAATRHGEVMGALRALQATLDKAQPNPLTAAYRSAFPGAPDWQPWPPTTDSCRNG